MAKPKLRDLSRRELSPEDYGKVVDQLEMPDVPDMVAALLGATLVEHQVDQAIRAHLKHSDDRMWGRLTDPAGPLNNFSSKVSLGFALGLYDINIFENLHIVRDVRNAFAHARTLLTFQHPTVRTAIEKMRPIRYRKRLVTVATLAVEAEKRSYLQLCFSIFMYFHLKFSDSIKRRERSLEAKQHEVKLMRELLASLKAARNSKSGSGS